MSSSPPISIQAAPSAAQTPATATDAAAPDPQPWWKFGHVWLVIAGPAIVVVAGFITFAIAARAAFAIAGRWRRLPARVES